MIALWDAWTRLFHWSLAISVLFLLLSGETGFKFYDWHRFAGEFALMLVVFRILWGLVGSSNIRFTAMFHHPRNAFRHLYALSKRRVRDKRGHNAAGSWAILIMLTLLLVQAVTGLLIADEEELIEGALYGQVSSEVSNFLFTVHHKNAALLKLIVGVHVVMIFIYWLFARKNLLTPMITGRMRWDADTEAPTVDFRPWWVGALCMLIAVVFVWWLVDWG